MLYDVKSSVFFFTRALWLRTRLSHVYNLISQKRLRQPLFHLTFLYFSLPLSVCILYQLLSFLFWRCFEKKIDQMWTDYRFLIFSKMSVQINAKKFSENSWETPGFSRTILHGNLAGSREYKQYRNQKQRQHKGHNKADPILFSSRKVPFLVRGTGESGFRREGRGESNLICLSPADSQPFILDKLTTSHPFSPKLHHNLVRTRPVPLRSLLSL